MNGGVKGHQDARLSMSGDARLFTSSLHHSLPSMLQVGPIAGWGLPVSHGVTSWGLYSSRFRSRDSFHHFVVCNPMIKLLSLLFITIRQSISSAHSRGTVSGLAVLVDVGVGTATKSSRNDTSNSTLPIQRQVDCHLPLL